MKRSFSHLIEWTNLNRLTGFTDDLRSDAEWAIDYAEQLQVKGATVEDLEGLEKSRPLIHKSWSSSLITMNLPIQQPRMCCAMRLKMMMGRLSSLGLIS